jgi:hypothetical protein
VSVGGLLALDQVLGALCHILPFLVLRQPVEYGALDEAKIAESRPTFDSLFGFWEYVMGKGCRPVGLPMLRPILYV